MDIKGGGVLTSLLSSDSHLDMLIFWKVISLQDQLYFVESIFVMFQNLHNSRIKH